MHFLIFFVLGKKLCVLLCFSAILDDPFAARNGFQHGPLRSLYGKYMGFKAYVLRNALRDYASQQINGMLRSSMLKAPAYSFTIRAQNTHSSNLLFLERVCTRG